MTHKPLCPTCRPRAEVLIVACSVVSLALGIGVGMSAHPADVYAPVTHIEEGQ